jgi:hypothetical protein
MVADKGEKNGTREKWYKCESGKLSFPALFAVNENDVSQKRTR